MKDRARGANLFRYSVRFALIFACLCVIISLFVVSGCDVNVDKADVGKLADKADVEVDVDIHLSREQLEEVQFSASVKGKADGESVREEELPPTKVADMICQLTKECVVIPITDGKVVDKQTCPLDCSVAPPKEP